MGVRNCAEIGENLQKIVTRLMANDDLVNLLYYTDKDPLSQPHLSEEQKREEIFEKMQMEKARKKFLANPYLP